MIVKSLRNYKYIYQFKNKLHVDLNPVMRMPHV